MINFEKLERRNKHQGIFKVIITILGIIAVMVILLLTHNVKADATIKELEENIANKNYKIEEIQTAKDSLHNTAEILRSENLKDDELTQLLSEKWIELHEKESSLKSDIEQHKAEIEKIKSRKIYLGVFEATAYCCGTRTATGTVPTANRTIAVDPRVIPYGSKVEIEGYGTYIAEDCGGAVKGNIVDIYIPGYNNCIQFGRRKVKVYILNE